MYGKFECIGRCRRSAWSTRAELSDPAETPKRVLHATDGLEVHKGTISYCVKEVRGTIHAEGTASTWIAG